MSKPNYDVKANKKWDKANREHRRYLTTRSHARGFIRNRATKSDLLELRAMIDECLPKAPDAPLHEKDD